MKGLKVSDLRQVTCQFKALGFSSISIFVFRIILSPCCSGGAGSESIDRRKVVPSRSPRGSGGWIFYRSMSNQNGRRKGALFWFMSLSLLSSNGGQVLNKKGEAKLRGSKLNENPKS